MKLLLIFRKYRNRYFLHNKKQRPFPASLPDTASACISRSRFDHAERFRCETALLDFSSLLLILSSRLPVLIRKLRFESVLLCAHWYRSRILAAEAGMTVFVASYQRTKLFLRQESQTVSSDDISYLIYRMMTCYQILPRIYVSPVSGLAKYIYSNTHIWRSFFPQ